MHIIMHESRMSEPIKRFYVAPITVNRDDKDSSQSFKHCRQLTTKNYWSCDGFRAVAQLSGAL